MKTGKLSFRFYYITLAILLILSLVISARVGAVNISYEKILAFIAQRLGIKTNTSFTSIEEALFFQIRLPRVLLCAFVGAALSVSGALMQALFRNPIVEPGLVGTSSGAALGAAFVFVMGKSIAGPFADVIGPFLLPLFAFVGGLAATLSVYKLSNIFGKTNVNTMLLAGIAVMHWLQVVLVSFLISPEIHKQEALLSGTWEHFPEQTGTLSNLSGFQQYCALLYVFVLVKH